MEIEPRKPTYKGPEDWFTGDVWIDPIVEPAVLPRRDHWLTLYQGARHEILNETNRDEVTADIIGWLQSKQPTGAGH